MFDLQDVCANVAQMYNNILFYIVYLKEIKIMSQSGALESFDHSEPQMYGKRNAECIGTGKEGRREEKDGNLCWGGLRSASMVH